MSAEQMAAAVVLIVEDEALIRLSAADILEGAGFVVVEASNADAAIEILESRLGIRIVFTDIDMPGSMDGVKLAAAVRSRWPPMRIIMTSGKTAPGSQLPSRSLFFPKPYSADEILAGVRELLS